MNHKEAFRIIAEKMDKRDTAIKLVKEAVDKNLEIPEEFKHMEKFINEKPWRRDYKVINTMRKAAKRMAKNSRRRK